MEPLPGSSTKKDDDTESQKSVEDESHPSNSNLVQFSQTPEKRFNDDKEVTETTEDNLSHLHSNNTKESSDVFSGDLQDIPGQEKLSEGQLNTDLTSKKIDIDKFSKYVENLTRIIKNHSVTIAYPSRHRPKPPFNIRPPEESTTGRPPPRLPPPPSYYTPTRSPEPPRPNQKQPPATPQPKETHSTAQSSAQNHAQGSGQATPVHTTDNTQKSSNETNVRRPGVPVFIDPMPYTYINPFFIPGLVYNTVIWAQYPPKLPSNVPSCLALLCVPDCLLVIKHNIYDYYSPYDEFFLVQNKNGECLYFVQELPDLFDVYWSTTSGYNLHFMDMYQNGVIFLNVLSGSTSCCCCYPEIVVHAPPGVIAGRITKKFNFSRDEFEIWGPDQNKMFRVLGSSSTCGCFSLSADYRILALDENCTEVGHIRLEVGYTGFDYYEVNFPSDMDVKMKAVFLSVVFLINL